MIKEVKKFVEKIPHSGQSLVQSPWAGLSGPIFRCNIIDTPLHKQGFDEGCLRCAGDKLIEKLKKRKV